MNRTTIASLIIPTLVLTGCGGSSSDPSENPSPNPQPPSNAAPVAQAGSDARINVGDSVTLNGESSSDADGDALTYHWKLEMLPEGSSLASPMGEGAQIEFTPDVAGEYVAVLIVNDGTVDSEGDSITITVDAPAPVAVITSEFDVELGDKLTFDASQSQHVSEDNIYSWRLVSAPGESALTSATFDVESDSPTLAAPEFDVVGTYEFELVITSTDIQSEPASFSVKVSEANIAPVISELVSDDELTSGKIVYLYSTVEDNSDEINYAWSFTSTPESSELAATTSDKATFEFVPDLAGDYTAQLVASDNELSSEPKTITISVAEFAPLGLNVVTSEYLFGKVNEPIIVDFSDSISPNGEELTYNWTVASGPSGSRPSITRSILEKSWTEFTGDKAGNYRIRATVSDSTGTSESYLIRITLSDDKLNPFAVTAHKSAVSLSTGFTLNATPSFDKEGEPMRLIWWPNDRLNNEKVNSQAYAAYGDERPVVSVNPTVPGYYHYSVVASGKESQGVAESVKGSQIHVYDYITPIIANAGNDFDVVSGTTVTFDGSKSLRLENENVTYEWSVISRPYNSTSVLEEASSLAPKLLIDANGRYVVQLLASDSYGIQSVDHVTIYASGNAKPVANAGEDTTSSSRSVELDGSASSDSETSSLSYTWQVISTTSDFADLPTLNDPTLAKPTLLFNDDFTGTVVVGLTVNDGSRDSDRDEVVVTIE
ncbi:hypothetical protein CA267_016020 [Alteromonas pelagimontana]|uniref:PKD/Chitinase domain-containing protein n=1 Tax=Alteromonas pelagimontana TaxID=1858656 RepID=A0A6M4MGA3_9ALTE|nr:PKD domain-containing protein [Alteromonas pelagimontana]QJR82149.1 hypothetical protein CA267_016020 [Alteromonas pelagimontana]